MIRPWTWIVALALGGLVGCAGSPEEAPVSESPAEPVVLEEGQAFELSAHVDQTVTLIGVQTRTKIPSVCGVDVDGDYELSDTKVTASGVLRKRVVAPPDPDAPIAAGRGPGTYYALERAEGGGLATTRPAP